MGTYITSCPVGCAAPLTATEIVLPEGALLRCAGCGQLVSQVTSERYWDTMARFDRADFNQPAGPELVRRNRVAGRRLRTIARLLGKAPSAVRLLDVGCSRGQFVRAAVARDFDAEGVEPAPGIAAAARAAGLKVHSGLLEEQRFPDASFDAITLFEVVEHLKEPCALLRECRRLLKARGILMLSTGNTASWTATAMKARWDYFHIDKDAGHVSFFNPVSLRRLATNCGFSVERIDTARVKFHEKPDTSPPIYVAAKLAAELLNFPARILGKGHDMLACLRRTASR